MYPQTCRNEFTIEKEKIGLASEDGEISKISLWGNRKTRSIRTNKQAATFPVWCPFPLHFLAFKPLLMDEAVDIRK